MQNHFHLEWNWGSLCSSGAPAAALSRDKGQGAAGALVEYIMNKSYQSWFFSFYFFLCLVYVPLFFHFLVILLVCFVCVGGWEGVLC